MKATLRFDLSDPDERMAHLRCIKALDMAIVLWEIRHNILNDKFEIDADEIRERINDLFEQHDINTEELTN